MSEQNDPMIQEQVEAVKYWHKETSKSFFEAIKNGDKNQVIILIPELFKTAFTRVEDDLRITPTNNNAEAASHLFFSILAPLPNSLDMLEKKSSRLLPVELEQIRRDVDILASMVIEKYPNERELLSREWSESTGTNRGGVVNLRGILRDEGDKSEYNPFDNLRGDNG